MAVYGWKSFFEDEDRPEKPRRFGLTELRGPHHSLFSQNILQVEEYRDDKSGTEEDYSNMYWRRTEYMEGEDGDGDGELSWFNAGVRVGVGIGLGICLGVGIGVGLLVRTYQSTSRNFRRHLP